MIKRLTELAPSALLGDQHFFIGWGLHRFSIQRSSKSTSKKISIGSHQKFKVEEQKKYIHCNALVRIRPHLPFLFPEKFGDYYPERPDSHDLPRCLAIMIIWHIFSLLDKIIFCSLLVRPNQCAPATPMCPKTCHLLPGATGVS